MTVTELPRALLREDLADASGRDVRAAARSGQWRRATHGLARGYVQANMAIVPKRYAFDFMLFCQRRRKMFQSDCRWCRRFSRNHSHQGTLLVEIGDFRITNHSARIDDSGRV